MISTLSVVMRTWCSEECLAHSRCSINVRKTSLAMAAEQLPWQEMMRGSLKGGSGGGSENENEEFDSRDI